MHPHEPHEKLYFLGQRNKHLKNVDAEVGFGVGLAWVVRKTIAWTVNIT